jgi:hypothetical protein
MSTEVNRGQQRSTEVNGRGKARIGLLDEQWRRINFSLGFGNWQSDLRTEEDARRTMENVSDKVRIQ